jgi:Flp pilus assembly protein TadB
MQTVTSFRASDVQPDQLSRIMADYLALERARIVRRLLVRRFGLLALIVAVAGAGFHWLPPFASWFSVGIFLVPPASAWIVEVRRDRQLARRLEELPDAVSHLVPVSADRKKVVKSS